MSWLAMIAVLNPDDLFYEVTRLVTYVAENS